MKARKLFAILSLAGALLLGMNSCNNEEDLTDLYQQLNGKWTIESNIYTITVGVEGVDPIQDTLKTGNATSIIFFSDQTLAIEDLREGETLEGTYRYVPEVEKLLLEINTSTANGRRKVARIYAGGPSMFVKYEFIDENTLKFITDYADRMTYEDLYYQYDFEPTEEQWNDEQEIPVDIHNELTLKRVTE